MATRSIEHTASDPLQVRQNTQTSIWDAFDALHTKGSSTFATREGIRVLSLAQTERAATSPSSNPQVTERLPQTLQTTTVSDFAPVVTWSPPTNLDPDRFRVDAAFDGTILEVGRESFIARLVNKLDPIDVQEDAEFAFSEIPRADRSLIAPGAMFYWFIGRTEKLHGQQSNSSLIRFRRLPVWLESDLTAAQIRASFLRALLPLDGVDDET